MKRNPIRVGVVGVGSMGRHHVRVYSELSTADLVGVADSNEQLASDIADEFDTTAYAREDLFQLVDAVSIAVPTPYHYEVAKEAITAGVSVLIEKPFVADYEEGRELIRLAREHDVALQVGHVERFNPAVVALADIVPDLDIIAIEAQRLGPPLDRHIGDSVALDLMIHDIDILLSLVDSPVADVQAIGARNNQYIAATIRFENGVVGDLTASRVTQEKVRRLSLTAEQCRVNVDYIDHTVEIHRHSFPEYVETNGSVRYRNESVIERPTVENGEPLKHELKAFVAAVRDGTEPVVTGEDGLRALELARRIDAIGVGRPVPTEL
ncbi:Gfo/Idh/MocA family protein [Halorarius litoreus]|uniref:Gfo/Idh/MocA family protein n=1 Tax=Halorarius litoreus TaxID=2962676 RepID=UPI0020CD1A32|nr:Gfo/Idh/MocA family oxidoreductase [Halorarius litoreus]